MQLTLGESINFQYKVVHVNLDAGEWSVKEYNLDEILGPVDLGVKLHFEKETWRYEPLSPENIVVIGLGVFSGSKLPGVNRGVVVFRSPLSGTIHVSTVGGLAVRMLGMGAHAIVIEGQAQKPSMLIVEGSSEGVKRVEVKPLEISEDKLRNITVSELAKHMIELNERFVKEARPAVFVVGSASFNTLVGSIVYVHYDPRSLEVQRGLYDFAGRGGAGTVLVKAHNIVGIVAGGFWNPKLPDALRDIRKLNNLFRQVFGKEMGKVVNERTIKYRFDPKHGSGGTFGLNYLIYGDLVPMLGFKSVYLERVARLRLHATILEHFWKPFNQVTGSNPRNWRTCGEACPAVCKKIYRGVKVDYEPFNALGPFIGVVNLDDALELVKLIDESGMDAIEAGYIVAWIFDLIWHDMVKPEDACLDSKPCLDPITLIAEPRRCSRLNARLAKQLLERLVKGDVKGCKVLELVAKHGLRLAAKKLGESVKGAYTKPQDLTVYAAFGDRWYMTPNLYWTPGLVAPIYVTGKYWTDYHPSFMEPEDYARNAYLRVLNEYLIDNAGICRFHRGWAEKILDKLYGLLGVKKDLKEHARNMYRLIALYSKKAKAEPTFWESSRTIDVIATIAAETGHLDWAERITKDRSAAREWWERFKHKFDELIGV